MKISERKLKRFVQLAVVGAISVVFVLSVTLVVQLAILRNQRAITADLNATKAELLEQLKHSQGEQSEMLTEEYIEKYTILYHNRGSKGSIVFK